MPKRVISKTRSSIGRHLAVDMLAGLALFAFLVAVTSHSDCSVAQSARPSDLLAWSAQAGERTKDMVSDPANTAGPLTMVAIPRTSAAAEAAYRRNEHQSTMLMLAALFSMLVAGNLAFFRHLRRVNASPRSGGARRG